MKNEKYIPALSYDLLTPFYDPVVRLTTREDAFKKALIEQTRENKLQTFREVRRVLKPNGELHVVDWGLPANSLMRFASYFIQLLDGSETTSDNFNGLLPKLIIESGFESATETNAFNSAFGTIRLYASRKF